MEFKNTNCPECNLLIEYWTKNNFIECTQCKNQIKVEPCEEEIKEEEIKEDEIKNEGNIEE